MATRSRKSRRSCKNGKLKRPVRTKKGGKRRCKKSRKTKSKKKYRMEVDGVNINDTIYTFKSVEDPSSRSYYIVKRIKENIYPPFAEYFDFPVKLRIQKELGKGNYITEVHEVDENGYLIDDSFNPDKLTSIIILLLRLLSLKITVPDTLVLFNLLGKNTAIALIC